MSSETQPKSETGTANRFVSKRRMKKLSQDLSTLWRVIRRDRLAVIGVGILVVYLAVAAFGELLAPHEPGETQRAGGEVLRTEGPTAGYWFGTTNYGEDILSQVIISTRVSVMVGLAAAAMAVFIGANVALISAYYGGWVDDILMRVVDIAYGLPFLPFVIVLVFILGANIWNIIIVIAAILWRDSARVVRSEVLSQKQRPYVKSARAIGASDIRIMYRHILPNVLPLIGLYAAFAVAYAIIYEASIAFLGFGDPTLYSWGQMLFQAYQSGAIRYAWWWVLPPGVALMLIVMAVFFIGRALEQITNPELRH
ncbi:ABC transporter permease [Natronolimnobius sp. AArcel1]|uniref:ABC transporter permease n=1 Tax=Natronolimnobius sp. AArcel1 TaxID=1679093 RepID=UPI0013ED2CFB|nr:ABC transporter permease [Natronolimnobius sp. AArcel1]NGM70367.1 ABC transporter permease [Natronolimnobius sp. AArcel1]